MDLYPEILLPKLTYPILGNKDIADCVLVRETTANVYSFLEKKGYTVDDILQFVIAPQPSLREVFELSLFLYGYYDDQHCGIRVTDTALYADWSNDQEELAAKDIQYTQETVWQFFLSAQKLNQQIIDFNGNDYLLSFSHKPTRVNYWHFELWVKDNAGEKIPRNKSNAHTKYLAKSILEYIIAEAIVFQSDVKPFKRDDFEKVQRNNGHC
jgi:hypothetical protein